MCRTPPGLCYELEGLTLESLLSIRPGFDLQDPGRASVWAVKLGRHLICYCDAA